jgi:hypothetical protein
VANGKDCQLVANVRINSEEKARIEQNNNGGVFPRESVIVHVNFFVKDFVSC